MRLPRRLVLIGSCALPLLAGCALSGGQVGPRALGNDHRSFGVQVGLSAGTERRSYTGLRDTSGMRAGHVHVELAWNLPGDLLSVGATAQHWQSTFADGENDTKLQVNGFGPTAWVRLFGPVCANVAALAMRSEFDPGRGIFDSLGGIDGPSVARYQVELDYNMALADRTISGVHVGYHWNRSGSQVIGGLPRTLATEGPYVEVVFGRY